MLSCILSGCSHTVVEHQFHIDTEYVTETEIRDEIDDVSAKLALVTQQINELKEQSGVTTVKTLVVQPENDEIKTVTESEFEFDLKPLLKKTPEDKADDLIKDNVTVVGIEFNLEDGAYGYILAWMKCLIEAYNVILTIPTDDLRNAAILIDGSDCCKVEGNETAKYYKVVRIRLYK